MKENSSEVNDIEVKFQRVCGNKNIHIKRQDGNILCGTKVKFQNGLLSIKYEEDILKEYWPYPASKWVTVPVRDYCKRCLIILTKLNQ